jgi:lysophospholipase L1-like esterase
MLGVRSFVVAALLVTGTLIAGAIAGEAGLRLIGFSYPAFHAPDGLAGIRLRPGVQGWYRDEGAAFVRINSDGWRDEERTKAKPAGTVRIVVLGDSFTEAIQVPQEATFTARLQDQLNACQAYGDREVEVLNFGVSSYGTAQQLLTLRHRASEYSPDVVLLAFLPSNDVRNNSSRLEGWKARPFFELSGGKLALDASFRDDPEFERKTHALGNQSFVLDLRLHQLLRRVREGTYSGWNDAPAAMALVDGAAALGEAGLAEQVFAPPRDAKWKEAWSITDRLLLMMHRESQRLGARFMVAVLTSGAAVYPDPAVRRRYAETLGVADFHYPERRIAELGKASGFGVIALGEPMQRVADTTGAFLHGFSNTRLGFGHWNADGHRVAAELLAAQFCAADPEPAARPGPA